MRPRRMMTRGDDSISLVMATIGRYAEPEQFIQSLLRSDYDLAKVELIVVDQNKKNPLKNMIKKYQEKMTIIYLPIDGIGLSLARNVGLAYCSGAIVGFPDDDCEYFPETLLAVTNAFRTLPDTKAVIGGVKDYGRNDIIRNWPTQVTKLTRWNFYTKMSSVGLFVKAEMTINRYFCEQLGAGMEFGAAEDADYIYNIILMGSIFFVPTVAVYHPDASTDKDARTRSYGKGFAGFCKKNLDPYLLLLFITAICYHLFHLCIGICTFQKRVISYRWLCISSRWSGFFAWPGNKQDDG